MITMELLMNMIYDVLLFCAIYLIVAVSLNLQYGYTGIPNFGLALSVAGGAYVAGGFAGRLAMMIYHIEDMEFVLDNTYVITEINALLSRDPATSMFIFFVTMVVGALVGAGLGFIASYPAIRLRATYLLMTLISMAEAIRIIGINARPLVGGSIGVMVPKLFAWMGEARKLGWAVVVLATALVAFLIVEILITSPFGRLIRAVRENEETAECVGKDVVRTRLTIMVVGSAIAALAGVLYSFHSGVCLAAAYTRSDWTFWPWLMIMAGGRGNNIGALVGTLTVIVARRLIIFYKHNLEAFIPFSVVWLETILIGAALILIMAFRPEGIIPEKPTRVRGLHYKKYLEKLRKEAGET